MPEHHLQRAGRTGTRRQTSRARGVPVLRRGPCRDVRRARRLDAVARRRLPVHGARPRHRTGRHDGAAASFPGRRQRVLASVGDGAALGGCTRHLPAHLSRRARRGPCRRVHAARPTVPAFGLLLAATGRAQPRRTTPSRAQSRRRHRGGPATAGPRAQRAGVPSPGRAAGITRSSASPACRRPAATSEKRWRWSTSTPRRGWRGRMPAATARWSSKKARSRCGACGWCTRPAMRTSRR